MSSSQPFLVSVANIAALRFNTQRDNPQLFVMGYVNTADLGEGVFNVVSTDTTSFDNGVDVIVDAIGQRWHRQGVGDTVSIMQCGAIGDGVHDDSPAINRFLAWAAIKSARCTLVFPDGYTFVVNNSITVAQSVSFSMGPNTTIKAGSGLAFHMFHVEANTVKFNGGNIVGSAAYSSINLTGNGCSVENVSFSGGLHGVSVNNGSSSGNTVGNKVLNCYMHGTADHAVFANSGGNRMLIDGNTFDTPGGNGVWVGNSSNDCTIVNNRVFNGGRIGIEVWNGNNGAVIGNNLIETCAAQGISLEDTTASSITGNVINNVGFIGIEIAQGSDNCIVSGNTINVVTTTGSGDGVGISMDGSGSSIVGNTIIAPTSFGIQAIQGGSSPSPSVNFSIRDNKFVDCGNNAIMVQTNCMKFVIQGNQIIGGEGAAPIFLNSCMYGDIAHNFIDIDETKYTHWFHINGSQPSHTAHSVMYNTIITITNRIDMFWQGDNSGGFPQLQIKYNRMFPIAENSILYPASPKVVSELVTVNRPFAVNDGGNLGNFNNYTYGFPDLELISVTLPAAIVAGDGHLQPSVNVSFGDFNGGYLVYTNTTASPVTVTLKDMLDQNPQSPYTTINAAQTTGLNYQNYNTSSQMSPYRLDIGAINTSSTTQDASFQFRVSLKV